MKHYFVCEDFSKMDDYWNEFKGKLNEGDEIVLPGYDVFSNGLIDLKEKLEFCSSLNIKLIDKQWDDIVLNPARELDNIHLILSLKNEKHREKQLRGIEEALKKKQDGVGSYGRPTTILPDDFEAKIIEYRKNHKPLERYRKIIKMKKSTFYKYSKEITDRLREKEELEKKERIKAVVENLKS